MTHPNPPEVVTQGEGPAEVLPCDRDISPDIDERALEIATRVGNAHGILNSRWIAVIQVAVIEALSKKPIDVQGKFDPCEPHVDDPGCNCSACWEQEEGHRQTHSTRLAAGGELRASQFIRWIAERFIEKHVPALSLDKAIAMAWATLEHAESDGGMVFGNLDYDWTREGAITLADEEIESTWEQVQ